jgi:diguanylate cyclase (GGDEF)-like protein/PAS domain S-box-containing protein
LSGYAPFECLVQQNLIDMLIAPGDRAPLQEAFDNALLERSDGTADVRMRRKDGSEGWIEVSWQTIHGKDDIYLGLRVSAADIEGRKDTEQRLMSEATRDSLTGLYNRRRFDEDLPRMLADAERRNASVGLLAFDLDGFKPINDRFGHAAGDTVLRQLAEAISATIRRSETFYRMGGDEFSILVGDTSVDDMRGLAQRISQQINTLPFEFEGLPVRVTASTGIALYPDHADAGVSLMAAADMAMYADKAQRDARVTGPVH